MTDPDKPVAGTPHVPTNAPAPPPGPDPAPDTPTVAYAPPPPPPPARPGFVQRARGWAPAGALGMLAAGLIGGLVGGGVVAVTGSFGDDDDRRHGTVNIQFPGERGRWHGPHMEGPVEEYYGPRYRFREPRMEQAPPQPVPTQQAPAPATPSPTS